MIRSLKQLYDEKLGSVDGEIGEVKDFYFNDQQWVVRYVVANTGSWLASQQVLLSPHAFGSFLQDGDSLLINLTRKQIENSPSIANHKPVSRQFEEEYYRYYGWPSYWDGTEMWGTAGFPVAPPPHLTPITEELWDNQDYLGDDAHLQSTKALVGYHIRANDEVIGHLTDFVMDCRNWKIRHVIVETGHWFTEKEIAISPRHIGSISYEDSTVFVNLSKEAILNASEFQMPGAVYHDTGKFED
jgi:uncharacterized protein YrrD